MKPVSISQGSPQENNNLLLYLVACGVITLISFYVLLTNWSLIIFFAFIFFSILLVLFFFSYLSGQRSTLEVNEKGIRMAVHKVGLIPWTDVKNVRKLLSSEDEEYIEITLKNKPEYGIIQEKKEGKPILTIHYPDDISTEELFATIEHFRKTA